MTVDNENENEKRKWADCIRFYLTALCVVTASISSFAFLFLVPFVIDPGFSTIFSEFDETPVHCVTTFSESFYNMRSCSWSSCREGCTTDVVRCLHVYVSYFNDTDGMYPLEEKETIMITDEEFNKINWMFQEGRLYPNVKGCGYPPDVNCTEFNETYSNQNTMYPCYYSKIQQDLVLTKLDLEKTKWDLIYAITIPWGAFIFSILYLILTYCGMRKPEDDDDFYISDEFRAGKDSKDASNYSIKSIGKNMNHRTGPDDKGTKRVHIDTPTPRHMHLDTNLLVGRLRYEDLKRRSPLPAVDWTPPLPRVRLTEGDIENTRIN